MMHRDPKLHVSITVEGDRWITVRLFAAGEQRREVDFITMEAAAFGAYVMLTSFRETMTGHVETGKDLK
jgi:hypothetical protein